MRSFGTLVSALTLSVASLGLAGIVMAQPTGTLVIADNETPENLDPANQK